jgi:phospholipase C
MNSRSAVSCALLSLPFILLLAGCQGVGLGSSSSSSTPTYQLSVSGPAAGSGTVTSSPAGINCPGTCSASFAPNTKVTLTATPAATYAFTGWSGACTGTGTCSLDITAATTVNAAFSAGFGLTVALAGAGTGTVTSTPAGINCSTSTSTTCAATFAPNAQVTLTETPATNDVFAGWSGACTGTASCSVTVTAASSVTATFGGSVLASINHIILFAQENRSLDHYFGAMQQYWSQNGYGTSGQTFDGLPQFNTPPGTAPAVPGCNLADDASDCSPDTSNPISSFHFASVCEENQSPFWNEAHNDWDYDNPADQPSEPNPPLNGFVWTAAYDARGYGFMDVNGVRAMGYYDSNDLNFYYFMASNFGTSDRQFSPTMDRTQVNRMFIMSATSQGYAYPIGGGVNDDQQLTATTIFEALQNAGISWRIYVNPTNTSYNGENCETAAAGQTQDMCLAGVSYMNMFTYESQIQDASTNLWQHFAPISQFLTDIQSDSTFPQFVLIEPASAAGLDEHPSDSDGSPVNIQLGAQYVENSVINPLMQSPSWNDSVLFFTYDEAGGLYDHVPPQAVPAPGGTPGSTSPPYSPFDLNPAIGDICTKSGEVLGQGTCDFAWTGYRVPFIVISPYSIKNYVSHTVRDTTAVLAFAESRFGIPALTGRDGYYLANTNMNEFFDFVNKPWATPPSPPAQSTAGTCDQTPPASWNEPPVLTVTVTGSGSVTSTPASAIIQCTSSCSATFSSGTAVTLTATANSGSTFTGWSGGGCSGTGTCSITLTSTESVAAAFTTP